MYIIYAINTNNLCKLYFINNLNYLVNSNKAYKFVPFLYEILFLTQLTIPYGKNSDVWQSKRWGW
jgi:hypothetical protein